jgi:hypothetical protein
MGGWICRDKWPVPAGTKNCPLCRTGAVAFSAGGDGGRISPELPTIEDSLAIAIDVRLTPTSGAKADIA